MTAIHINIPFIELTERRDITIIKSHLDLFDTYLQYHNVSDYQCLNEEKQIWEDAKSNYRWTRLRKNISNVDVFWHNDEKKWALTLHFNMDSQYITWYFNTQKECLSVYDQLVNYFINQ